MYYVLIFSPQLLERLGQNLSAELHPDTAGCFANTREDHRDRGNALHLQRPLLQVSLVVFFFLVLVQGPGIRWDAGAIKTTYIKFLEQFKVELDYCTSQLLIRNLKMLTLRYICKYCPRTDMHVHGHFLSNLSAHFFLCLLNVVIMSHLINNAI